MHACLATTGSTGRKPAARLRAAPSPPKARTLLAVSSAVLYAVVAIGMNFVNKATMQQFPAPLAVLFLQMVATIATLAPLQQCRVVTFATPFSMEKLKSVALLAALYTSNTAFALIGLRSLNIPMFSSLKRLTPVLVLLVKAAVKRQLPSWNIAASVVLVMLGCVVAGLGDLTFEWTGYACALLSCTLQASYLILVEHSGAERGMGSAELLFYSAVLSTPALAVLSCATGEASAALALLSGVGDAMGRAYALAALLLASSFCGCLLNYSLFLCTVSNNALTTTIVGVLKGVVATILGYFLLGGVDFHWLNVTGVALNTVGGVWYTLIHYRMKHSAGAANSGAHGQEPVRKDKRLFGPIFSSHNLPALAARTQSIPLHR